jgi:hypothetical protein
VRNFSKTLLLRERNNMSREHGETSAPEAATSSREIIRMPPPRFEGSIDRWFLALFIRHRTSKISRNIYTVSEFSQRSISYALTTKFRSRPKVEKIRRLRLRLGDSKPITRCSVCETRRRYAKGSSTK